MSRIAASSTQAASELAANSGRWIKLTTESAEKVRDSVGRVSDVTWSKVQNSAQAIHETQGFALRQLAGLAEDLSTESKVADLEDLTKQTEGEVQKWLAVLARCFELHDAVGAIEIERVLDSSPDEIDRYRVGLLSARDDRLELITERVKGIVEHMQRAVASAKDKVLFNPIQSPAIVKSTHVVTAEVRELQEILGIDTGAADIAAPRWAEADNEKLETARTAGAQGIDEVKRFGQDTRDQARSAMSKLAKRLAERRSTNDEDGV